MLFKIFVNGKIKLGQLLDMENVRIKKKKPDAVFVRYIMTSTVSDIPNNVDILIFKCPQKIIKKDIENINEFVLKTNEYLKK